MNKEALALLDEINQWPTPPEVRAELAKLRELLILPRQVFVLWDNDRIDYSEIRGIFLTQASAEAAMGGRFFDVEPVTVYE